MALVKRLIKSSCDRSCFFRLFPSPLVFLWFLLLLLMCYSFSHIFKLAGKYLENYIFIGGHLEMITHIVYNIHTTKLLTKINTRHLIPYAIVDDSIRSLVLRC